MERRRRRRRWCVHVSVCPRARVCVRAWALLYACARAEGEGDRGRRTHAGKRNLGAGACELHSVGVSHFQGSAFTSYEEVAKSLSKVEKKLKNKLKKTRGNALSGL